MRHTQPSNAQRARNALTGRSLERFATSGRKYAASRQNARRHGLAVAVADDPTKRSQGAQSNQLLGYIIPPPCSAGRPPCAARPQRHCARTAPEELAVSCIEACRWTALGAAHLRKAIFGKTISGETTVESINGRRPPLRGARAVASSAKSCLPIRGQNVHHTFDEPPRRPDCGARAFGRHARAGTGFIVGDCRTSLTP
jgi:hypothetical protein